MKRKLTIEESRTLSVHSPLYQEVESQVFRDNLTITREAQNRNGAISKPPGKAPLDEISFWMEPEPPENLID